MNDDGVCIVLYDDEKRFLLQHRDDGIYLAPDMWAFFGGGLEQGETPEQCVVRECFEEINYQLKNPKLVLKSRYSLHDAEGKFRKGVIYVFVEKCVDKSGLKLQEGQGWGWFSFKEAENLDVWYKTRQILKKIKASV